jgi:capsular polysaccharide biosynthesis protein
LLGQSVAVFSDNHFILETLPYHFRAIIDNLINVNNGYHEYYYKDIEYIKGKTLIINVSSPSMSHFIFEGLTFLLDSPVILDNVIVTCGFQKFIFDMIKIIIGKHVNVYFKNSTADDKIIFLIENAIVPVYRFELHPIIRNKLKSFLSTNLSNIGHNEKIYIARNKNKFYRVMLNEEKIISIVKKLGFEVLDLDSMEQVDIIDRFRSARYVIGPLGAGLYNSVYCNAGTKVVALCAPNYIRSFLYQCSAISGVDLHFCIGPDFLSFEESQKGGHNDFIIDENEFTEILHQIMGLSRDVNGSEFINN